MKRSLAPLRGLGFATALTCLLLASCTTLRGAYVPTAETLETAAGRFELEYPRGERREKERVVRAVLTALPRVRRWGTLREPVALHLLPSHEHLEAAVDQYGLRWMRAWARYGELFVQMPRSWGLFGATQAELEELFTHELTHCVMYQAAATRTTWQRKQIPPWFREGMASFTADQGYRRLSLEDVAHRYARHAGVDPLSAPGDLYKTDEQWVYSAAHHAFAFLVRRYGDERIRALLQQMQGGERFPEAFVATLGLTPAEFTADFERYVRLRGFRGGRLQRKSGGAREQEQLPAPVPAPLPTTPGPDAEEAAPATPPPTAPSPPSGVSPAEPTSP